jgi:hypothetical protein
MTSTGGDEKAAVAKYFNGVGFERWNKIYGTTDDVNSVRPRRPACCAGPPSYIPQSCRASFASGASVRCAPPPRSPGRRAFPHHHGPAVQALALGVHTM